MPQPTPIAVSSWVIAVNLSPPETVELLQTTSAFVHARMLITISRAPVIGTVYFSNDRIA
jgi:hypothetical protein